MVFSLEKYKYFEKIFSLKQKELKQYIFERLQAYYSKDELYQTEEYIYAIGDIPIALVAHLDTVWEDAPPKFIFYDPFKNAMCSPLGGLGADDRAGCLAILEILNQEIRPHIIFTTDEEIGGIGAYALSTNLCPFKDLHYIIELDRRGKKDCVFYDCETKSFQRYIESFGFKTAQGTFSDISILCGAWEICGVNLSIGYYNEHSPQEVLFLTPMYNTINKVIKMLKVKNIPHFKWEGISYIPQKDFSWINYTNNLVPYEVACKKCHKPLNINEAVGAKTGANSIAYYCFECMQKNICYCPCCGEPYENPAGIMSNDLCFDCLKKIGDNDDIFKF